MSKLVIIEKASQVEELIHYCKQTKYASIDYETTSFNYHSPNEYPLILGVSFQPGSSWILPLGHKDSPFKNNWQRHFATFGKEVLQDWDIVKVAWNLKFEYKWAMAAGVVMKGRLFDAMLAKYCLDEERPNDLKSFVAKFFPKYAGYEDKLRIQEDGEMAKVDWKNTKYIDLCEYCGIDSDLTLRGMIFMEKKLIKLKFYNLFRNMLMMVCRVLAESEYRGILVDRKYLEQLIKEYQVKIAASDSLLRNNPVVLKFDQQNIKDNLRQLIKTTEQEIAKIAEEDAPNADRLINNRQLKIKGFLEGKFANKEAKKLQPINFNSPPQVINFLYTHKYGLKLPVKAKTDTGMPSTAEDTLKDLQSLDKTGFIKQLLEHRGLVKLDSTYISGMLPHLDLYNRAHANFKINGTVTGRLSCVQPNLQNIPRDTTASDIKRMFIPPPGYLLGEADYSQAELRIIAELSGDKAMIDIFNRNYNIHVATACKMNGVLHKYDEVKKILKDDKHPKWLHWEKEKKKGKSLNFSIVYQQGIKAMAETMKVSEKKAMQFQKEWFAAFPQATAWIKKVKRQAHENEYVYNMFGGKRRLYDINEYNSWGKPTPRAAECERQAVNAPVQGASGYFTLFSQVVIRERQMINELPKDMTQCYTVHDSTGFWLQPSYIHEVVPKIITISDNPETEKYFGFKLRDVKMKVSFEVGPHWAALKDYDSSIDYKKLLVNY